MEATTWLGALTAWAAAHPGWLLLVAAAVPALCVLGA